jgi:hypothetical protein
MLAFAVPAVLYALASGGLALLLVFAFVNQSEAREPLVAAGVVACTAADYLLVRGFRRAGWERWAQLVAGMWLGHGAIALLFTFANGSPFAEPSAAGWILLFAMGVLLPIVGWALWPRKGEVPLWRWAVLRS